VNNVRPKDFPMADEQSPAVQAGHQYFRETPMRAEKGSAMSMIAAAADQTKVKSDRLKAAREARDAAEQLAIAEAPPKPVKRKRKVASAT
jgi:hypothetical protein